MNIFPNTAWFASVSMVLWTSAFAWAEAPEPNPAWFVDITQQAGVEFVYDNGMTGEVYFVEIMGGGVALFDYNNDGLLDIYLTQAGALGPGITAADRQQGDRLFRNDSIQGEDGFWTMRFTDVTAEAGIDARGYGMGVAIGDINNSGFLDIYVLNFGDNQLWRNNGDGTFTDITSEAGVNDSRWSVSASFVDLDGNGWLDLYVANYVDYQIEQHRACRSAATNLPDYCSPSAYQGVADRFFRNLGGGRFEDASETVGIAQTAHHGLGVIAADFTGDGRVEIYVANDGSANNLWLVQEDGRWLDDAFMAGVAVNAAGAMEAGMGVDAADFDRSGSEAIFITHMRRETNTLYRNQGNGWFTDVTSATGLGTPSLPYTGFGTAWLDANNNGWLDLVVGNGAVVAEEDLVALGDPYPYHQANQLFLNSGTGRFVEAEGLQRGDLAWSGITRGLAVGDLNNNGRLDVVEVNINGPARVLLNQADQGHTWLGLEPRDAEGRRVQTGTVAWLLDAEGQRIMRRRSRSDGSYASANDPRMVFGLADASTPQSVELVWPDGHQERFVDLELNRYHVLLAGTGIAISP